MTERAHVPKRAQNVPKGTAYNVPMCPPLIGGTGTIGSRDHL